MWYGLSIEQKKKNARERRAESTKFSALQTFKLNKKKTI